MATATHTLDHNNLDAFYDTFRKDNGVFPAEDLKFTSEQFEGEWSVGHLSRRTRGKIMLRLHNGHPEDPAGRATQEVTVEDGTVLRARDAKHDPCTRMHGPDMWPACEHCGINPAGNLGPCFQCNYEPYGLLWQDEQRNR